jgi:hypothetical protein
MRFVLLYPSTPIQVDDTFCDADAWIVGTVHEALTPV